MNTSVRARALISSSSCVVRAAKGSPCSTSALFSIVPSTANSPPRISSVVEEKNVALCIRLPIRPTSVIRFSRR